MEIGCTPPNRSKCKKDLMKSIGMLKENISFHRRHTDGYLIVEESVSCSCNKGSPFCNEVTTVHPFEKTNFQDDGFKPCRRCDESNVTLSI